MSELGQMQEELLKKEQELANMTKYVKHDQEWLSAAQEKGDFAEWKEYSDPRRAQQLQGEIASLRDKVDNYTYYEQKRMEEESKIASEKNKETIGDIKATAKAMYEEKMNSYMQQNFWGKAKMMLKGKKPKKMTNMEIMETYGKDATQQELDKIIFAINQRSDDDTRALRNYYTEHPEDLRPGETIDDIVNRRAQYYESEINRVTEDYNRKYDHIMEQGEKWGMKL